MNKLACARGKIFSFALHMSFSWLGSKLVPSAIEECLCHLSQTMRTLWLDGWVGIHRQPCEVCYIHQDLLRHDGACPELRSSHSAQLVNHQAAIAAQVYTLLQSVKSASPLPLHNTTARPRKAQVPRQDATEVKNKLKHTSSFPLSRKSRHSA